MPIQGRELFENQCARGACSYPMESQDWIDVELGVAPDSIYKEYGMYSPSEIKAYEERFPTCENVYLKTYKDGSGSCRCDYGAYGEKMVVVVQIFQMNVILVVITKEGLRLFNERRKRTIHRERKLKELRCMNGLVKFVEK